MEKVILIKYGELTTKKGNRNLFIKILTKNIEEMLQNYDVNIIKNRVRMFIEVNDHKFEEVVNQLKKVFGLHSIVICERIESNDLEEIKKIAKMISDTLSNEIKSEVYISIGTVVNDLKDVSRSYKEAKMALEVGKIFENEKHIVNYEKLGIGRLIYQLPLPLCRMFIKEVLHGLTMDDFDDETLATVNKFFENNLNVSETSRQLYIHRNTLVYRLDKLQKMTGLDLRNFDDAIIFKITLMVSKYMIYMDKMSY